MQEIIVIILKKGWEQQSTLHCFFKEQSIFKVSTDVLAQLNLIVFRETNVCNLTTLHSRKNIDLIVISVFLNNNYS